MLYLWSSKNFRKIQSGQIGKQNVEIWMYGFSFENNNGSVIRDGILGNVKEVLKENKTLDDVVLYFQFGSGTFDNQKNTSGLGFFKGVSLTLQCQIKE